MNWVTLLQRWTMRSIHAAILGAALLGSASAALAQVGPAAPPVGQVQKHYTKARSFDLPVKMDQDYRRELKEIRLYARTPTSGWTLVETGGPDLTRFACKAPLDGEYWYTLVTVDRAGRMSPSDLNTEPVSQRVVIDTTPPVIQVQPTAIPDGDYALRCTVLDANPDLGSLRAVCRTETGDVPLDMVVGQPGVFRVRGAEMMRHPLLVMVKDKAGNECVERVNLRDMIASTLTPQPQPQPQFQPQPQPQPTRLPSEISQTVNRPDLKNVLPGTNVETPTRIETPGLPMNTRLDFPNPPAPIAPPPLGQLPPLQELPIKAPTNIDPIKVPVQGAVLPTKAPGLPPDLNTKTSALPNQLINTNHANIDYRIDHVGPSGVGKVEIFMTPDNGQSWHRLAEDVLKRSPVDVALPGDGVYGIRIVAANGNGFGGKAPIRGDAPHCTVEVDTTKPFVQLRSVNVMPGAGHVEITWNATDKNLGSAPVTLSYRTRPDGPWQVIAANIKNDGSHRWAFPRDAGAQFYFKIDVADLAGNIGQAISQQPILIDMSEPRVNVVGVTGGVR